jgi:hypothetical protein
MRTGLEILMIGDQTGDMPSSIVVILFFGVLGSRILYHVLVKSLNTTFANSITELIWVRALLG